MKKIARDNKELIILEGEIERLNRDKYFGGLYDQRIVQKKLENTARIVGYDEGKAEGLLEGENKEKKVIAKALLKEDIPIETISKCTNLSIEEINNLL